MKRIFAVLLTILLFGCTACVSETETSVMVPEEKEKDVYSVALPGEYDSVDTAVVSKISEINNTITFYNYELERQYTLSFDSVTKLFDKYGTAIAISQLKKGTVVDLEFLKSSKLLTKLTEAKDAFYVSDVTGFAVDAGAKTFTVNGDVYKVTEKTALLNVDKGASVSDFDEKDSLTISGFDSTIYGIVLEKGHGELALEGDEYFTGGFIEIGSSIIQEIEPDMHITLREGEYDVNISKNLTVVDKHIVIERGKNTVLDLSDVDIVVPKKGKVFFDVVPETSLLYIDNALVDPSKIMEFDYGMHYLIASADGYQTTKKYFNVGEESATLSVELEPINKEEEEEETSQTEGYFILVSAPTGVEVSFDGNYIGISPVSIKKTSGAHTIELKKSGCVSRTYSVTIENTAENVYYSFADLVQEQLPSAFSVSGNP